MDSAKRLGSSRWEWRPWRRVAQIRREPNRLSDQVLLALSADRGVVPRPDDGGRQLPSEETVANYWKVQRNDVVINPMWAFQGGVAVSAVEGAVSTAYRIYKLSPELHPRFVHYFLRSRPAIEQFGLLIRGVTTFDRSVTREDFDGMPFPVPPIKEQRAIADFLDRETARIDALIAKRQRMTGLLEERLSALTSSLLWQEDPFPYEVRRLKHLNGLPSSGNRDHSSFTFSESGVPCLRGLNVRPGRIELRELLRISQEDHVRHAPTALRAGDLVIVRSGLAGSAVAIPESFGECNCVDLVVVRRSKHLHPRYLEYVVNSREAQEQVAAEESGALLKHFNAVDAGELRVPYRPLALQEEIVRVLDEQADRETAAMERLRRQASLMLERRQALITAAVTGQMDIPSAA